MASERALLVQLVNKINSGRIVLPTLPEVAIAVRELSQQDDSTLSDLANEISKDPGLAATLISLANSAAFGGLVKTNSVIGAVTRLGLEKSRDLASASAMHQLFYSEQNMTWDKLEELRLANIDVASCALAILASEHQLGRLANLSADVLLLACQVHNIGALPLVDQAEKHPHLFNDKAQLDRIIELLQAPLGKTVLNQWHFPAELVESTRYWADLSYQTPEPSYLDLVRLAALYTGHMRLTDSLSSVLDMFIRKGVLSSVDLFGMETYFLTYNEVQQSFHSSAVPAN
ncbi:HDOD domain-containing protein [Ferrimonas lipolytica]|uniref:HDOD domain-containing protein n=1 Tax=Ferrimonas lipolytica TaxID=2724191 RepID=A0A6H1UFN2_9GAMM|nr:HDOD domain-containing protein [Ferrimonas lipolytica]QIZ77410.1 HDOD domain-containing protein [Ferrimonas lipolytica]